MKNIIYFKQPSLLLQLYFRSTTQIELLREIDRLNDDPNVHGIIVQMPLDTDDKNMDSHLVSSWKLYRFVTHKLKLLQYTLTNLQIEVLMPLDTNLKGMDSHFRIVVVSIGSFSPFFIFSYTWE